jgi:hypothetical protein
MLHIGIENTTALADLHVGFWREFMRIVRFSRYIAPEISKYIRYLSISICSGVSMTLRDKFTEAAVILLRALLKAGTIDLHWLQLPN